MIRTDDVGDVVQESLLVANAHPRVDHMQPRGERRQAFELDSVLRRRDKRKVPFFMQRIRYVGGVTLGVMIGESHVMRDLDAERFERCASTLRSCDPGHQQSPVVAKTLESPCP
jgi:hypothetical protein